MPGLKEAAEKIKAERNKKWRDSWDEWERVTFIDHIIAKLKRADNCPPEFCECSIDAYNYAMELRRRLSGEELNIIIIDHLLVELERTWARPWVLGNLDAALSRAVELKRRLLKRHELMAMTTNYRRGADFEREVRAFRQKQGDLCWRTAGSKGEGGVDLIDYCSTSGWRLIQCKKDGRMTDAERSELRKTARRCGAEARLAVKENGEIFLVVC